MTTTKPDYAIVAELQAICRGLKPSDFLRAVKSAEIGGSPEAGFEKSFASLAYSYISDKAPGLLQYIIGFQLVDRNDDNTKAVGVFGFKIGDQWLYVPVFFLSGDMKGHELLYLKNQDMFVPLKESWVNYLINKQPQILGDAEPKTINQLGIMSPDITATILPRFNTKYSSYRPWAKEENVIGWMRKQSEELRTLEKLDAYLGNHSEPGSSLDMRNWLTSAEALQHVTDMCEQYPGVKVAMYRHYGPDVLLKVAAKLIEEEEAAAREEAAPPSVLKLAPRGSSRQRRPSYKQVPVNTYKQRTRLLKNAEDDIDYSAPDAETVDLKDDISVVTKDSPIMTDNERQTLLRDGQVIRDNRTDPQRFTMPYTTSTRVKLMTPTVTGIYKVLSNSGKFVECLVVVNPIGGRDGGQVTILAMPTDKSCSASVCDSSEILVSCEELEAKPSIDTSAYDKAVSKDSLSEDSTYIAVTRTGQGTNPFHINADCGEKTYEGSYRNWIDEYPGRTNRVPSRALDTVGYSDTYWMLAARKGSTIQHSRDKTYLPVDAKFFEVDQDKPRFKPGRPEDYKPDSETKTASIKLYTDVSEVVINSRRMTKVAGVAHLVVGHGLSEQDAKAAMKTANLYGSHKFDVVYAKGYPASPEQEKRAFGEMQYMDATQGYNVLPMDMPPTTSGFMGYPAAQMTQPYQASLPIPSLSSSLTNRAVYNNTIPPPDPQSAMMAQQAGQQGQKEVFDTAMLRSLTKAIHPGDEVDKDLGNISKTLTSIGKMLFMFYWHNEEFQERYGKKDLPELEDALRNSFEMLGDLLLYLKQKTVDTLYGVDLRSISPDLQNAAN